MPTQAIAPAAAGEPAGRRTCAAATKTRTRRGRGHLSEQHPLAAVVRDRCRTVHPKLGHTTRLGSIGCGQCWEYVIRTDERVAVEHDLPPLSGDDTIVDEVAIARAIKGEPVHLTRVEKAAAVAQMAKRGAAASEITQQLRINGTEVIKLWPSEAVPR